jgi:hypothetical protein
MDSKDSRSERHCVVHARWIYPLSSHFYIYVSLPLPDSLGRLQLPCTTPECFMLHASVIKSVAGLVELSNPKPTNTAPIMKEVTSGFSHNLGKMDFIHFAAPAPSLIVFCATFAPSFAPSFVRSLCELCGNVTYPRSNLIWLYTAPCTLTRRPRSFSATWW